MNKKFLQKWKLFIDSLKLKSNFLYIILYDLLFYVIFVPIFLLFSLVLNNKAAALDPELIANIDAASITNVTAAQTQDLRLLAQSMQNFIYFFAIGIILLIIICLLAFTLSRASIWNYLLKKKFNFKHYLKFNLLNILLAVILAVIIIIILILRTVIIMPLVLVSLNFALLISSLLFLIIFTAIIYFVSLIYINYTKTTKISEAFNKTFKLLKTKFADISYSYLFILVVSIIISLLARLIWFLPFYLQRYFNFAVILIFLAWMRIYIINVIKK
jgi:hypothetical protein